jgi:hypothetical protein
MSDLNELEIELFMFLLFAVVELADAVEMLKGLDGAVIKL